MARTKGGHQKICTGLLQVPTEQSLTPKEGRRTTPIGNITRTMAGNQHDIIRPLPKSNRIDTIVVIVNRFTKIICLKTTMTNISLEGIAKIYRDDICKLHGVSRKILSNRRLQFVLKFIEEFMKALGQRDNY